MYFFQSKEDFFLIFKESQYDQYGHALAQANSTRSHKSNNFGSSNYNYGRSFSAHYNYIFVLPALSRVEKEITHFALSDEYVNVLAHKNTCPEG